MSSIALDMFNRFDVHLSESIRSTYEYKSMQSNLFKLSRQGDETRKDIIIKWLRSHIISQFKDSHLNDYEINADPDNVYELVLRCLLISSEDLLNPVSDDEFWHEIGLYKMLKDITYIEVN